jgi:hypothetical protein
MALTDSSPYSSGFISTETPMFDPQLALYTTDESMLYGLPIPSSRLSRKDGIL